MGGQIIGRRKRKGGDERKETDGGEINERKRWKN